jgi:hypothetical protein
LNTGKGDIFFIKSYIPLKKQFELVSAVQYSESFPPVLNMGCKKPSCPTPYSLLPTPYFVGDTSLHFADNEESKSLSASP